MRTEKRDGPMTEPIGEERTGMAAGVVQATQGHALSLLPRRETARLFELDYCRNSWVIRVNCAHNESRYRLGQLIVVVASNVVAVGSLALWHAYWYV